MRDLEIIAVTFVMGSVMVGTVGWYASSYNKLVDAGKTEMFASLEKTPMTEPCPGSADATCKTFGDYRLRQTANQRWEVSSIGGEGKREVAVIDKQNIYIVDTLSSNRLRDVTVGLVESVTGKKLADFHGKS